MLYNAGLLLMTTNEAGVAQLVERNLAKVEVESSRLFSRSTLKSTFAGNVKMFLR